MIRSNDRGNTRMYGFANGFLNIGWLTGWLRREIPNQEPIPDVVWLQPPSSNLNLCMPIKIDRTRLILPQAIRDRSPVHFITRFEAEKLSASNPSVLARALLVDRPDVRNMPPSIGWNSTLPAGAPVDDWKPLAKSDGQSMRDNSNVVKVAGILSAKHLKRTNSKTGFPVLELLLQQHEDPTKALHVRVYGSACEQVNNLIEVGHPLYIEGQYFVNPKPIPGALPDANGIIPVTKYGYIKTASVRTAIPDDIPGGYPEWAHSLHKKGKSSGKQAEAQAIVESVSDADSL